MVHPDATEIILFDQICSDNQRYYYRLKQIDFDGAFSYSTIQSALMNNSEIQIDVHPNSVQDQIFIDLQENTFNGNKITMNLLDALGRKVLTQTLHQKKEAISIQHIPTGICFLK